jgi:hypothetical protein
MTHIFVRQAYFACYFDSRPFTIQFQQNLNHFTVAKPGTSVPYLPYMTMLISNGSHTSL